MNVYSLDVKVGATVYIKANSPEEAREIADRLMNYSSIQFSDRHQNIDECGEATICMDGRPYSVLADNEEPIALSPVMTIHGVWSNMEPDLVEKDIDIIKPVGEPQQ